jgi:hypothetical protein
MLASGKCTNSDVPINDCFMYITELLERYVITLLLPSSGIQQVAEQ